MVRTLRFSYTFAVDGSGAIRSTRPDLAAAVNAQLDALTADCEFHAPPELPTPREWDRYDVALTSAMRRCDHRAIRETLYRREWQCELCGRYFDQATLPRGTWW